LPGRCPGPDRPSPEGRAPEPEGLPRRQLPPPLPGPLSCGGPCRRSCWSSWHSPGAGRAAGRSFSRQLQEPYPHVPLPAPARRFFHPLARPGRPEHRDRPGAGRLRPLMMSARAGGSCLPGKKGRFAPARRGRPGPCLGTPLVPGRSAPAGGFGVSAGRHRNPLLSGAAQPAAVAGRRSATARQGRRSEPPGLMRSGAEQTLGSA